LKCLTSSQMTIEIVRVRKVLYVPRGQLSLGKVLSKVRLSVTQQKLRTTKADSSRRSGSGWPCIALFNETWPKSNNRRLKDSEPWQNETPKILSKKRNQRRQKEETLRKRCLNICRKKGIFNHKHTQTQVEWQTCVKQTHFVWSLEE